MYKVFPLESVAYVIVSLSNLDWGVKMCFYHGMTEYAKMWLRFAFPVYLFLIVLAMIYASRYSHRIEKLTRKSDSGNCYTISTLITNCYW